MSDPEPIAPGYLVPLAGPQLKPLELNPSSKGIVIGRHEQCDIALPADADKISRFHARFDHDGSGWHVTDLGSRWGTFLNGIKLAPQTSMPISFGDLIRIIPWTFDFSATPKRRGPRSSDDFGTTVSVRAVGNESSRSLAEGMLTLLLESAAAIQTAKDEKQLGDFLVKTALRGTEMQNAAMLRSIDAEGGIEIIASKFSAAADDSGVTFSRSLIDAASRGVLAEIETSDAPALSESIVRLAITSALCVPLMLGDTVAAYLYLDARNAMSQTIPAGAGAFCLALARMVGLALSNIKHMEMEKRAADLRAQLAAASAAQKWIMPARDVRCGSFRVVGESRAGQYVGGDFFDFIPLREGRLAVALGDVCGKGFSASVLMTATQGYLHAAVKADGDVAKAVADLNRFVHERRPADKFVTVWVGIFDAGSMTLTYVDAGHGYALLQRADHFEMLDEGRGLPVGVDCDSEYFAQTKPIQPGDRVMIVSDGIIEQFGIHQCAGDLSRVQFGISGVENILPSAGGDFVGKLLNAVVRHAGTENLSDDATVVEVTW
jgi:sigma-B regulation protein RsbU (phosphoserine phosphatase)